MVTNTSNAPKAGYVSPSVKVVDMVVTDILCSSRDGNEDMWERDLGNGGFEQV